MEDTIVQISTAPAAGAVAIIRLSGRGSVQITKKIFLCGKFQKNPQSHRIYYGKIADGEDIIDEVLVSVMLAPKSYTKEDVVEINCHGGLKVTQKILALAVKSGARLAEPGEFTKRAFLNGRIDLSQAEAVSDLINSSTELARKTAFNQLNGYLKEKIILFRETLLTMIAQIEVSIDYPEHDMQEVNTAEVYRKSKQIYEEIKNLIGSAEYGKIIHEGIETVIAGRPNVGKSSLLNAVLNENRAIVTDIPGTTRDVLQEYVNLEGIVLKITDTAGIHDTSDAIEKIGVQLAKTYLEAAQLVLFVVDGSAELNAEDYEILELIRDKKAVVIINKADLEIKTDKEKMSKITPSFPVIEISAKTKEGIKELYSQINGMFLSGDIAVNMEFAIHKQRHLEVLRRAAASLEKVFETAEANLSEDFLTQDLADCYTALGEIIGETAADDIVDKIFSEFCVGK
ncbi:MAG: tRNA uridine-5-carboxymethylaminomethyl(34) synthesis GTPase MnmE [Clostridiales bacterium]|jgi:tRNA modification GTPase|nr:tRNA uridine-5-carboxymethylaminomethyl(34) synthesis GTPase MnmE [Clostridiales bacterium]